MNDSLISVFCNLADMLVCAVICVGSYRLMKHRTPAMSLIFFLFGSMAFLTCGLYWLVLMLMRPGVRLAFTAAEISENGSLLLWGSALAAVFPDRGGRMPAVTAGAVLFTAANVVLWIAWSGEWVKDILGGPMYGYFLCVAARSLYRTEALSRREWIGFGVGCGVLIAAQGAIFFLPAGPAAVLDALCYVLLFCGILFFLVKTGLALKYGDRPKRGVSLAFSGLAWSICTQYMSADPIYYAAMLFSTLMLALSFWALRREVLAL